VIKIFIVTYNSELFINTNLKSLFESDADLSKYSVEIINNHSNLNIYDEFIPKIKKIHHQSLRPDFSCGHIARDWNAGLVNGFENLKTPACDQVILCQDDMIWNKDWMTKLNQIHKNYTFYTHCYGDSFMSFLPDAIKQIGLFDERYSSSMCQENDYFLRAVKYNYEKSSINDTSIKFFVNKQEPVVKMYALDKSGVRKKYDLVNGKQITRQETRNSVNDYSYLGKNLFKLKWNTNKLALTQMSIQEIKNLEIKLRMQVKYPYFEDQIENIYEKGYDVDVSMFKNHITV
jgi:hypothetical protein